MSALDSTSEQVQSHYRQQAEETVTLSELASQTQSLHQHPGPCAIVDSVTTVHPHDQPEECHDLGCALLIIDI